MVLTSPIVTYVILAAFIIVCAVGGGVVLWGHNGALSFDTYLKDVSEFAIGLGLVGVGRGLAVSQHAKATRNKPTSQV
jgi:hypothetical protein